MHQPFVTNAAILGGDIVRISQCQSFCLAWDPYCDPRCGVRYWEEIVFSL